MADHCLRMLACSLIDGVCLCVFLEYVCLIIVDLHVCMFSLDFVCSLLCAYVCDCPLNMCVCIIV